MASSIDNLINVAFRKGQDLSGFGLKVGGKGDYRPPQFDAESLKFEYIDANESYGIDLNGSRFLQKLTFAESQDFTRATTGTFIGSNGQIQTAAIDAPRFTHDPVTREVQGLLIEGASTNLIKDSENVSSGFWGGTNRAITQDTSTAPNGRLTADTLAANNAGLPSLLNQQLNDSSVIDQVLTASLYVKQNTSNIVTFNCYTDGEAENNLKVNLATGQILEYIGANRISALSENVGNGWYRVCITWVSLASGANIRFRVWPYNRSNASTDESIYVWGAMLEEGREPTSYIPTTSAQVTRAADSCVRVLGNEFNNNEGTIIIELKTGLPENNGKNVIFLSKDGSNNEAIKLRLLADNDTIDLFCRKDGLTTADTGGPSLPFSGKLGLTYSKTSGYVFVSNGLVQATVSGADLVPNINKFEFSRSVSVYKSIVFIPKALSESELIALTGSD